MDRGFKIYPHDDISNIEKYMETIRNTHVISRTTFENLMNHGHYSGQEAQAIKQQLQKEGYIILGGQVEYIHNNKLRKINKKYSVDVAYSKVDLPPAARPMIMLSPDTLVEQDENGDWILTPN